MKTVIQILVLLSLALLSSCNLPVPAAPQPGQAATPSFYQPEYHPGQLGVPRFDHIVIIVLENREYNSIFDSESMPYLNRLAAENTLLSQYYGIRHPSLPNYLALIGGDTFGIDSDCTRCTIDAPTLPDQLEKHGLTWKGYMEDMPSACFTGSSHEQYAKRHNPFVYFDPIRLDAPRCESSVVPLSGLLADLESGSLPNYAFISPDVCNDSHDCGLEVADSFLSAWVPRILSYPGMQKNGLLVITFDEGTTEKSCCGLETGGGHVLTVLISPHARQGYTDTSPYNHYALLKTIAAAWSLQAPGLAGEADVPVIQAPWKKK